MRIFQHLHLYRLVLLISLISCFQESVDMKIHHFNGYDEGGRIYFYDGPCQSGKCYVLDIGFRGYCYRIKNPPSTIESIDTNGACIYIFSDDSCAFKGPWKKLRRFEYESNDLTVINMDGKVKSVRSCSAFLVPVYLYQGPNYSGSRIRFDLYAKSGCTNVPRNQRDRETRSVRLNDYASCVILYSGLNCEGEAIRVRGPFSPEAGDLRNADFYRRVQSLQTCKAGHRIHAKEGNLTNTNGFNSDDDDDEDALSLAAETAGGGGGSAAASGINQEPTNDNDIYNRILDEGNLGAMTMTKEGKRHGKIGFPVVNVSLVDLKDL